MRRRASFHHRSRAPVAANVRPLTYVSERFARAARFGLRVGAWGGILAPIAVFFGTSRAGFTYSEFANLSVFVFLGVFAALFVLTFALAYAFPPPSNRIEFPGAGRLVWPLVGLLFLATAALVWMAISSQKP